MQDAACKNSGLDISEIIFHILKKYGADKPDSLYDQAMKEFKTAQHFIEDDMRSDFPALLEKIARAFHPITEEENDLIQRFRKDLERM